MASSTPHPSQNAARGEEATPSAMVWDRLDSLRSAGPTPGQPTDCFVATHSPKRPKEVGCEDGINPGGLERLSEGLGLLRVSNAATGHCSRSSLKDCQHIQPARSQIIPQSALTVNRKRGIRPSCPYRPEIILSQIQGPRIRSPVDSPCLTTVRVSMMVGLGAALARCIEVTVGTR
jgi:hypothetical protein